VNAGMLGVYAEIPKDLLELVEDVLLNRRLMRRASRKIADAEAKDKAAVEEDECAKAPSKSGSVTRGEGNC